VVNSQAAIRPSDARKLDEVSVENGANVRCGALIHRQRVGREIYVRAKRMSPAQEITLTHRCMTRGDTEFYLLRGFSILLDFGKL